MNPIKSFVFTRTYPRWMEDQRRRETYQESVARLMAFHRKHISALETDFERVEKAILEQQVMPSMRSLATAGPAAEENNIALYNCSFLAIDSIDAFVEVLLILMSGTGVGFSVEQEHIAKLPRVEEAPAVPHLGVLVKVEDSTFGWVNALSRLLHNLWKGYPVRWDVSQVRPKGARLKKKGGRASGPEPLVKLFEYCVRLFEARAGERLSALDCHDLVCAIAQVVVVGGVRRSSLISLSELNDLEIAEAKVGQFWINHPQRRQANNSAVYSKRPSPVRFLQEWQTLVKSQSGERGMFNRRAALAQMTASGRRLPWPVIGTNPCGEIILRDKEFCNLTEVVIRPNDTLSTLKEKVKTATMLGCWQATYVNFPLLREDWKVNCEEERLLGVSLTGLMDNPVLNHVNDKAKKWLAEMKHVAIQEAKKWSKLLGINMPAAITCVKPSGTVSLVVDTASGIHPRYAQYYIRRVRISATDPLFKMLRDQGVPAHPEVGQSPETADTWVLEFPTASPKGAKTRHDYTALDQLEHWMMVKEFWCEHNPSITVYVREDEWMEVGAWLYRNFDAVSGISFLPKDDDHVYELAPIEQVSEERYRELMATFPEIDYSKLSEYEVDDETTGSREFACVGNQCEIA